MVTCSPIGRGKENCFLTLSNRSRVSRWRHWVQWFSERPKSRSRVFLPSFRRRNVSIEIPINSHSARFSTSSSVSACPFVHLLGSGLSRTTKRFTFDSTRDGKSENRFLTKRRFISIVIDIGLFTVIELSWKSVSFHCCVELLSRERYYHRDVSLFFLIF